MSKKIALIAAVCVPLFAPSAFAADATDTMTVQATFAATCTVNVLSNINFGAAVVTTTTNDAAASFELTCSNGTPYTYGIDQGNNVNRQMNFGANTADYDLYTDAGHTTTFPTIAASVLGGTGTGAVSAPIDVFAQMPVQATPVAGTYNDTVTVTVRY